VRIGNVCVVWSTKGVHKGSKERGGEEGGSYGSHNNLELTKGRVKWQGCGGKINVLNIIQTVDENGVRVEDKLLCWLMTDKKTRGG